MRIIFVFCLLIFLPLSAFSQRETFRGSIPETLFRPSRGEAPHFAEDYVIGELGRGGASAGAFSFANFAAEGFTSGRATHPALTSINPAARDDYLSAIRRITPENFRLGGGRVEADGAVSFLIRFIGREMGITGEMYIKNIEGSWVVEELIIEEPVSRSVENQRARNRSDFYSYERFF